MDKPTEEAIKFFESKLSDFQRKVFYEGLSWNWENVLSKAKFGNKLVLVEAMNHITWARFEIEGFDKDSIFVSGTLEFADVTGRIAARWKMDKNQVSDLVQIVFGMKMLMDDGKFTVYGKC